MTENEKKPKKWSLIEPIDDPNQRKYKKWFQQATQCKNVQCLSLSKKTEEANAI